MTPPVLFDLFSGAGGAGEGYYRAGFRVIGVDLHPMPRYPHEFVQADAMQVLRYLADGAEPWPGAPYPDAVHASPPCQRKSKMTSCRPGLAAAYPDLVAPVHELLTAWGGPWVIENVEGAGLPGQDDLFGAHGVMLCGAMFGRELYRHRWFRASFPLYAPNHPRHLVPASRAGHWRPGTVISVEGNCSPIALAREVMGIDWTTRDELSESIPPYYTEYLGGFLAENLTARASRMTAPLPQTREPRFPPFGADQLATLRAEMALFEDALHAAPSPSLPVRAFLAFAAVFTAAGYRARRIPKLEDRR